MPIHIGLPTLGRSSYYSHSSSEKVKMERLPHLKSHSWRGVGSSDVSSMNLWEFMQAGLKSHTGVNGVLFLVLWRGMSETGVGHLTLK